MKPLDNQLQRLLQSAAAAPKTPSSAAMFTLEARVLGQWRAGRASDSMDFFEAWFRRAAIGGCLLALASVMWTVHVRHTAHGGVLAVAESAMTMGVEP